MQSLMAANWKLFKTPTDTREFFKNFVDGARDIKNEIIFFPPATSWEATQSSLLNTKIKWGAQNTYCETQGAFTGENSAQVLKELSGNYVLVGHSERRKVFGETDELLAKKMKMTLDLGLTPMLCIGETLQERDGGKTNTVNLHQLTEGLKLIPKGAPIVVAYEPVWAIGTGKVATPDQAQETHQNVHEILKKLGFQNSKVLYGGSVKPDNAQELLSRPGIDGFLVGGASLDAQSFLQICRCKK